MWWYLLTSCVSDRELELEEARMATEEALESADFARLVERFDYFSRTSPLADDPAALGELRRQTAELVASDWGRLRAHALEESRAGRFDQEDELVELCRHLSSADPAFVKRGQELRAAIREVSTGAVAQARERLLQEITGRSVLVLADGVPEGFGTCVGKAASAHLGLDVTPADWVVVDQPADRGLLEHAERVLSVRTLTLHTTLDWVEGPVGEATEAPTLTTALVRLRDHEVVRMWSAQAAWSAPSPGVGPAAAQRLEAHVVAESPGVHDTLCAKIEAHMAEHPDRNEVLVR